MAKNSLYIFSPNAVLMQFHLFFLSLSISFLLYVLFQWVHIVYLCDCSSMRYIFLLSVFNSRDFRFFSMWTVFFFFIIVVVVIFFFLK